MVAGEWVPDREDVAREASGVEEDTAVEGVDCPIAAAVLEERRRGRGHEAGEEAAAGDVVGEEPQHGRRAEGELAESAAEALVEDEAAPALADCGGGDEARRVVRAGGAGGSPR